MLSRLPPLIAACCLLVYWGTVVRKAVRFTRKEAHGVNLIPGERIGRWIRVLWIPTIIAWCAQPWLALRHNSHLFFHRPAWVVVGFAGAAACLGATIATFSCWREMRRSWRIGIDPGEKTQLIFTGPFRLVRHPIYTLSVILVLGTLATTPTRFMLAIAIVHITCLHFEARREERYLTQKHGEAYTSYAQRVGRFLPRGGSVNFHLNDFQQLMRRWAVLAPYNAGHIMRLSGVPDIERWRMAFDTTIATLSNDAQLSIEVTNLDLDTKATEELNRPFAPAGFPLRVFVSVDQPDSYLLGLIYDHWFADSPSIRALMQRAFLSYTGLPSNLPRLRIADDIGKEPGTIGQFFTSLRDYLRHRRAHRVHFRNPLDFRAGFFSMHFPDGAIDRIRVVAKTHGATVNDLIIATAAQVLGEFTAPRRNSKRNSVAIATAVDLSSQNLEDVFGFFVGYFTTVYDCPEKRSLTELIAATAHETSLGKTAARAQAFTTSLRLARWFWDQSPKTRTKAQLFSKGLPIVAGISNVDLTGSWADQDQAATHNATTLLDYFRVSPAGPLLPLVFTLTTIRSRLTLGVTYRTTAFSKKEAQRIATELIERLALASGHNSHSRQ